MSSGDGPKNESKSVLFVVKYVVRHGTPLDEYIDLSKTRMWHLRLSVILTI
jgi:hypothetical protein